MQIDRTEARFLTVAALFLVAAALGLVISVVGQHATLPAPAARVDPTRVSETPPFDNLGLHQTGENTYEAVMIARVWNFDPASITIPAGAEVTFTMTSEDVVHGFRVPDTNINAMVIPGQVTEVIHTFEEATRFTMLCHEYCGIGHHTMGGEILVEEGQ